MSSEQTLSADVVIVGSGVAGSSIANELARTGISVIVLEAGPVWIASTLWIISAIWKTSLLIRGLSRLCRGRAIRPTR